ncbi:MAG: hypothetical protein ACE5LB_04025 [Acidiferrobacterales bacterium]
MACNGYQTSTSSGGDRKHPGSLLGVIVCVVLALTACGGGDGNSDDSGAANASSSSAEWGTAAAIGTETPSAVSPQVAVDGSGNAMAVWQQQDGDRYSIRARRYHAASGEWGDAEVMETVALEAFTPKVAMAPGGNAAVVWLHYDGDRYQVWVKRYDAAAAKWSDAQLISTTVLTSARAARADIDDRGNAVVVWYQENGGRYGVWAGHYDSTGGWSREVRLDMNTGIALFPRVAMDGRDNAIVVWYQEDGSRNNVWANRYDSVSGWNGAELIESSALDASAPQVAMSANGDGMALWYGWDGARYVLWANRFSGSAKRWGTAEIIEADNAGAALDAQVTMDGDGNAIVAWQTHNGTLRTLWTKRYDTVFGWGISQLIETVEAGFAERPQLAIDSDGDVMAVWAQSDGSGSNVWANQFN